MKLKDKIIMTIVIAALAFYLVPAFKNRLAFGNSSPTVHEAAPGFSLKDGYGRKVSLSDFKGKVVLVNFWASWCPPCKTEIPGFENLYAGYRDKGFAVIGIAVNDVGPSVIRKLGITYPVLYSNEKVVSDYGNISSIPTSFLIGKDGRIIRKVVGPYEEESLRKDVELALAGKEQAMGKSWACIPATVRSGRPVRG